MTHIQAPWVTRLLSWHGHDRGGVHVPFQNPNDRPIPQTIETSLVVRLRNLAERIAEGDSTAPRYIFLIGGPGNGKSEIVQDFLTKLDEAMGMGGKLVAILREQFKPSPLIRRQVQITSTMLEDQPSTFQARIGRLLVIQDASATESASGEAATELVDTVADLLTTSETPPPVFLVCANRGLLAHALKNAHKAWGPTSEVAAILMGLIKASSLGLEALAQDAKRPSCWPLASNSNVACWPMDFESLVEARPGAISAFEQIMSGTILNGAWVDLAACADCEASGYCPFEQNIKWLRDDRYRANLCTILRRGELATGQHWNFRDVFSLIAELVVGQWSDFGISHPCDWVCEQVQCLLDPGIGPEQRIFPVYRLVRRLYPQALFASSLPKTAASQCADLASQEGHYVSFHIAAVVSDTQEDSSKHIRRLLQRNYTALDPAQHTPQEFEQPLCRLEEEFSQSNRQGIDSLAHLGYSLALSEVRLLELVAEAEAEWSTLTRNWAKTGSVLRFLRRAACMFAKRSVGVREGFHRGQEYLAEYQEAITSQALLTKIRNAVPPLFGGDKFRLNLLESFGQPQADEEAQVILATESPGIRAFRAPIGTDAVPGHDVPYFEVAGLNTRIPITFDFYLALKLRQEGCAGSSLPASVRAAIDKMKHQYAGRICRDRDDFVYQKAYIQLGEHGRIGLDDESAMPGLQLSIE